MKEIEELDPEGTDIVKRNVVDRYIGRPNSQCKNGMHGIVDPTCFAIFITHYYLNCENKDKNDNQLDVLGEETQETPQVISPKGLSSSEKLKLQKTRQKLRYYTPKKHLHLETSRHYFLFMFYAFRDENALKVNNGYYYYCQKLFEEDILYTISESK